MILDDMQYWQFREDLPNPDWNYDYYYFSPGEIYWVNELYSNYKIRTNEEIKRHLKDITSDMGILCNRLGKESLHTYFTRIL